MKWLFAVIAVFAREIHGKQAPLIAIKFLLSIFYILYLFVFLNP